MPRKILHLDLDAFFCSVEENRDPTLRGKAFVVGGSAEGRGVVASASYPARVFGVRSAMPTAQALRLCPTLIVVHGRHAEYGEVSRRVMERIASLTALIEPLSIDEAFMDLSDLPQTSLELARALQRRINTELHLPCSIGIATNKLVAKIATDTGKATRKERNHPPNSILEVPPGGEAAFLAPLPVQALWGIGPKSAGHLNILGINTIGDLARLPEDELSRLFGRSGAELRQRALGIDPSPVVTEHAAKSVSQETTFERDVSSRAELEQTLCRLAEKVCLRLRQDGLAGITVRIKLRWPDFTTLTRQVTLRQATDQDGVVITAALALFHGVWQTGMPVRLLGVGVSGLGPGERQLPLWDTAGEKEHRLLEAVDELRQRYGKSIIRRARDLPKKGSNSH